MRLSLLALFFSLSALAQIYTGNGGHGPCTQATIVNGGEYNCTTLTINASPIFTPTATSLIIRVQGSVTINAPLDLNGANGLTIAFSGLPNDGGLGGPGAGNGGGDDGGGGQNDGSDMSDASGKAGGGNATCAHGGGGGGFSMIGYPGGNCGSPGGTPGQGGSVVPSSEFNLNTIFRGGFGGGAGNIISGDYGAGGGGGGAIHILAGGDITISTNMGATGRISASGGNGGDGGADGSGGGAGSGGVIWLQTLGNINLQGSIEAIGGTGGDAGNIVSADGGNGGIGLIRLEDADGIITGGGSITPNATVVPLIPIARNFESSISCGSIRPSHENQMSNFMQMFAGFMLIVGTSFLFKQSSKLFS